MIATAKVKNGKVIHRAIDMGGFLFIACNADPTTMRTIRVDGEVTCGNCLGLKKPVYPSYVFAYGINALRHPFCRTTDEYDGFSAGNHDGSDNLKVYLPKDYSAAFLRGYKEGYYSGQQTYTYHYTNGRVKDRPLTNVPLRTFGNSNNKSEEEDSNQFIPKTDIPLRFLENQSTRNKINGVPKKKESKSILSRFTDWIRIQM